ncbi:MAG: hypothetical protein HY613_10160 [Candidatus Rokubacteria bacterium]|nr:hypothetical protein [Candidatus Rokubacteria bacterium]
MSLRQEKVPIVHPLTGELLGELDVEVARGRVVEFRDRFSVVEIQSVAGRRVNVKDRAVPLGVSQQEEGPGNRAPTRGWE